MEKKRSIGVTICAIILLALGLSMAIWVTKRIRNAGIDVLNKEVLVSLIFAQGILSIATSIGLYLLQEWMRKLCVFFSGILCLFFIPLILLWIVRDVWLIVKHGCGGWGFAYAIWISPFIILRLYLLLFLTRPKVKEQFE